MRVFTTVRGALAGRKTYILAIAALVYEALPVVLDWTDGTLLPVEALQALWEVAVLPLVAMTLRAGIAK